MKREWWIAVVLLVALLYWLSPRSTPPPEKPIEISTSQPRPTPVQSQERPVTPAVSPVKRENPPLTAPPHLKPIQSTAASGAIEDVSKKGLVHFKIQEGLAVAFGDVILGKLVGDGDIQEGLVRPPTPQPWLGTEIAYIIASDLPRPERVEQALAYFNEYTPVKFVPFQGQKDALVFEKAEAVCESYVGRMGGLQPIRLGEICTWHEVLHEIMHALGFVHEHSRTDRDQYVAIERKNIDPQYMINFDIVPDFLMRLHKDTPFDYSSIMIYPSTAFAQPRGQITVRSLDPARPIEPTRTGLSPQDLERINRVFGF